jgi:hypothetical protein
VDDPPLFDDVLDDEDEDEPADDPEDDPDDDEPSFDELPLELGAGLELPFVELPPEPDAAGAVDEDDLLSVR